MVNRGRLSLGLIFEAARPIGQRTVESDRSPKQEPFPEPPPDAPAPGPTGSITRTRAPFFWHIHAIESPKTPAPKMVTSAIANPSAPQHGRRCLHSCGL